MLENFIYAKEKSLFEEALNNGEVLDEAIVFIEDTKEIWNHGTYFDCSSVDLSGIEASIQNIIDTYATKTEIPTKVSQLENDANYVPSEVYSQGINQLGNNLSSNINDISSNVSQLRDKVGSHDTTLKALDSAVQQIGGALNDKADKTELPTKVSQLDNDACYVQDIVIDNGIYAIESGGNLIPASEATPSCIGVAVVQGEHRFMIGKYTQKLSEKPIWGNSSYLSITNYETVDGTNSIGYLIEEDADGDVILDSNYHNWTEGALSDFWGNHNTNVMREKGLDGIVPLVDSFNNGNIGDNQGKTDWYVPSCGQLALIVLNMAAISSVLLAIGGDDYETLYNYWCSTESTIDTAWRIDMSTSKVHTANKSQAYRVCLIRSLDNLKSITERVSALEDNKANKTEIPTKVSQLENDSNYITASDLNAKQDTLVSGTNIKTINGESILGSGDIIINNSFGGGIPIVEELDPDASLGTLVRYKQNINIDKVEIINKTCSIKDLTYRTLDPDNDYYNYVIKGDIITKINFLMPNVENIPSKFKQECCAEFIICSNTEWFGMGVCYDQGSFEVYGFDGRVWEIISNNQINQEGMEQLDNFFNNSKVYYSGIFLYPDSPISIEECFDLLDYFITVNAIKEINTTEEITKVVPYIKQQYGWESLITENSDFNNDFNFDFD